VPPILNEKGAIFIERRAYFVLLRPKTILLRPKLQKVPSLRLGNAVSRTWKRHLQGLETALVFLRLCLQRKPRKE